MRRLGTTTIAILAAAAVVFALMPAANAAQTAQGAVVSDDPVDWTPYVMDGRVLSVVKIGDRVFVGGDFDRVKDFGGGQPVLNRSNLFAYDVSTGRIDTEFAPVLDEKVETVARAPGGKHVLVGGKFTTVDGEASKKLAKLDAETGERDPNFATAGGTVRDMVVKGNDLYIGGAFTDVNGIARSKLARLDATTGAVDTDFDIPVTTPRGGDWPFVRKIDVSSDGARLVLIGNFMEVGGQPREQLGMIDLTTSPASVSPWSTTRFGDSCHPVFWTYTRDVEFSPAGDFFVVVTTGAYRRGRTCDSATRWETYPETAGLEPTWIDWTGGDTLYSVAITGSAVYVGGHQRWLNNAHAGDSAGDGAVPRDGIAALDPQNGMPLTWNPGRSRGVGAFELVATADNLIVGSDTDELGGEWHPKLGMFPLEGGPALPTPADSTLPNDIYRVELDGSVTAQSFDGSTYGPATTVDTGWNGIQSAFMVAGNVYYAADDGNLYARSFDGTSFGNPDDLESWVDWNNVGAMTWDEGRLYYTKSGDPKLYFRYLSPESNYVGSWEYDVSGNGDGLDWSNVAAMTVADGRLYYSLADAAQWSIEFTGGAPIAGTQVQVAGPGVDAANWDVQAMFHFSPDATPTPVASAPPLDVYGVAGNGSVDLTWNPPVDEGGSPVTEYTVTAAPGGETLTVDASTTQATLDGLTNGTTYTFEVTATNAAGTSAASTASNLVVPVGSDGSAEILFVVGDPAAPGAGDQAVSDHLGAAGYNVTVADDNTVTAADADGAALVLISSTVSGSLGDTFRDVDEPVVNYKPSIMDKMDMTGTTSGSDFGSIGNQTSLEIVDPAHALAAGRSGTVKVVSDANRFAFGVPGGDGQTIATVGGAPTIFAYSPSAALADGSPAPGCRVGVHGFHDTPASYVTDGWVLFDTAVAWAIEGCGV